MSMPDGELDLDSGKQYYLVVGTDRLIKPIYAEVKVKGEELYFSLYHELLLLRLEGRLSTTRDGMLEGKEVTFAHARNEKLHMTVRRVESR